MATVPSGRRAIVILTDGEDTGSAIDLNRAINKAQAAQTPVFTVGFGPKVRPDVLRQVARLTGGNYVEAPLPSDLQGSFRQITQQLRQQYVVGYRSQMTADMKEHELLVRLSYQQDVLESTRRFLARVTTPIVTMKGPDPAAVLRGQVRFVPEILSAVPITQATYLLDGGPLAQPASAPFALDWDTAKTAAGKHEIAFVAVDQSGRKGTWSRSVSIAPPLEIRFQSPASGDRIGGQATLAVTPQAAYDIAEVAYTLDGQPLQTVTAPPYQWVWRTAAVAVGSHRLEAHARDVRGNTANAEIQVEVVPPVAVAIQEPQPDTIVSQPVAVKSTVASTAGLARVELWVDGAKAAERDAPPYEFFWDPTGAVPGVHRLTVRAFDLLGETAQQEVSLRVPLTKRPLSGLPLAGVIAAAVLAGLLLIWWAWRRTRRPVVPVDSGPTPLLAAPYLLWQRPDGARSRFPLVEGDNAVGRAEAENQVVIPAATVSRRHAVITVDIRRGTYTLHNLSERSHSVVNGRIVRDAQPLCAGDHIEIGDEKLIFMTEEEES